MKNFTLAATLAAALAVAACSQQAGGWDDDYNYRAEQNTALCVDKRTGRRMPDNQCRNRTGGATSAYAWYFLGRSSRIPYHGEAVSGGSYRPTAGAKYFYSPASLASTRSVAVSRGGFGSTAGGRSGGFGG